MKPFDKATLAELHELVNRLKTTAVEWAKKHNISGLSHSGRWNLYTALEDAPQRALEIYDDPRLTELERKIDNAELTTELALQIVEERVGARCDELRADLEGERQGFERRISELEGELRDAERKISDVESALSTLQHKVDYP